jgi:hypothetical protein
LVGTEAPILLNAASPATNKEPDKAMAVSSFMNMDFLRYMVVISKTISTGRRESSTGQHNQQHWRICREADGSTGSLAGMNCVGRTGKSSHRSMLTQTSGSAESISSADLSVARGKWHGHFGFEVGSSGLSFFVGSEELLE